MVGAIVTMKRKASKAFLDSQPGGAQPKKQHGELGSNVDDHNEALNATEDSDVVMNEEIHDYGSVLAREESDIDMDEAPYERALGLGGRMIPREDSMEIDSEGENGMDTDTNMNLDNEPSSQDDLPARPPMREDPPDEASMVRGLKGKKPASKTKKKSTAPSAGDELNAQDDLPARPPTTEDPPDEASLARGLKGKKPAKEVEEKSIAPSAGDELNAQDDLPARPPTTEDPPDEASLARGLKGKKPAKEVEEKSIAPAVGNELNAQDDLEEVEEESTAPAAGKTKTGRGKQIKEYWGEMPDNERLKGVTLKNCINYNLAPLSDANAIFRDLTDLGVSNGLLGAVTDLDGMDIRVATMCSGTESPLLALGMICECKSTNLHAFPSSYANNL